MSSLDRVVKIKKKCSNLIDWHTHLLIFYDVLITVVYNVLN